MSFEFRIDFGRAGRGLPYGYKDGWVRRNLEAEFNERKFIEIYIEVFNSQSIEPQ